MGGRSLLEGFIYYGNMAGITREIVMALDPYRGFAGEFSWPEVEDGNSDERAILCVYQPPANSSSLPISNDGILLGTKNLDVVLFTFLTGTETDPNGSATESVEAIAITGRIDPTMTQEDDIGGAKSYHSLEFPHLRQVNKGLDFEYCVEEEAAGEGATWLDMHYTDTDRNFAYFPEGIANWVNIKIKDNTEYVDRDIIDGFRLHYYELFTRGDEAT